MRRRPERRSGAPVGDSRPLDRSPREDSRSVDADEDADRIISRRVNPCVVFIGDLDKAGIRAFVVQSLFLFIDGRYKNAAR